MRALSVFCGVVVSVLVVSACQDGQAPVAPGAVSGAVNPSAHAHGVLTITPISGPDTVGYGETPTYSVSASGGVTPYTYNWSSNYPIDGSHTDSSVKIEIGCYREGGEFSLTVIVTDAENYSDTAYKGVKVAACSG